MPYHCTKKERYRKQKRKDFLNDWITKQGETAHYGAYMSGLELDGDFDQRIIASNEG